MIVLAIIVGGLIVWSIVGGVTYHSSGGSSAPISTGVPERCADCTRLDAWWNSRDFWGKLAGAVYYAAAKFACAVRGC